jgi:four helix bundle protein
VAKPGADLRERTKNLAIEVLRAVESVPRSISSDVIVRQLVRCGTSVGANYRAACRAQSRASFVAKIAIVIEECDEVQYWLEVLNDLRFLDDASFRRLHAEADQLISIFVVSITTAKSGGRKLSLCL